MARVTQRLRELGRGFKRQVQLYRLVACHPRTPRIARWLLLLAIGYAMMPFDLIPDWIPVLGLLDDVIILPLLVYLSLKLVPKDVYEECRQTVKGKPAAEPEDVEDTDGESGDN
ncbi:MAG: YkvA family protein [Armatimonadia bacterium]